MEDNLQVRDIYREISLILDEHDLFFIPLSEQKVLIDYAFKQYLTSKINKLGIKQIPEDTVKQMSTEELLNVFLTFIPEKHKRENTDPFIFCLTNIIGNLQGYSIVWYEEDDPKLIKKPLLKVNEGKWDTLTTHKNTSSFKTFAFLYGQFQSEFMNVNQRLPI